MKVLFFQFFLIFFFVFYGCIPTSKDYQQLVYSESSLKYSSYIHTDVGVESNFQTIGLYTLFEECHSFEAQALNYMYDILFGSSIPPLPSLVSQEIKSSIGDRFSEMSSKNVREISQHMGYVYELALEFFLNKTKEAIYKDWHYIENSLDANFEGEIPDYVFSFVRSVQGRLERVSTLTQPFRGSCEEFVDREIPGHGNVTFLAGMNVFEMADHIHSRNLMTRSEFLRGVQDKQLTMHLLNQDVGSLEGYLLPGSYTVSKGDKASDLLSKMVKRFTNVYDSLRKETGLTRHQVVILASMIEKEAVVNQEKSIISSVFLNRLRDGMKLQSDPTVSYGVLKQTGVKPRRLTRSHLNTWTPYNTYKVRQLPLGPISNPGTESLLAVFNPKPSPYFFFVSRGDGRTHNFSVTYDEHKKHVQTYRKKTGT